jgi:Antitoxin VbhA
MESMSKVVGSSTPTINAADRALRLDAVRQATATIRLEGGVVSTEDQALDECFIAGDIDLDSYVAAHLPLHARATGTVARSR